MQKLKLSAIPDDKPVKLTVELPAAVTLHVDRPSLLAGAPRKANDKLIPPVEIDRRGFRDDLAHVVFSFARTRQAQESSKCRMVVARQPYGAELKHLVTARDRTEDRLRK